MSSESEPPLSFSSLNIRTGPSKVRATIFGKVRSFSNITVLEWVYLVISVVGLITSFGLTVARLSQQDLNSSDFTFAILLLLTIVFCCYYVVHAMLTERWDELMVFVTSNIIVFVYCIINYLSQGTNTVKLVRLVIVSVLSPFLIGVGILQSVRYFRSNNLIFNTVGGSSSLQKSCRRFFICSSLLKFDLQLQLSMLILVMGGKAGAMDMVQKIILGSGIPVTLIFIILGFIGLRQENQVIMAIFYVIGLLEPAYIAYKFYYSATYERDNDATYESTFTCGCIALAVWSFLMVLTGYYVSNDFGKGLKEKLFEDRQASSVTTSGS